MTSEPLISAILAMSENRVIGKNNQLPWHLPGDMQHFKTLTLNHAIIMGRKTFTSMGKPLLDRINIVMTRDHSFHAQGCHVVTSLEEALAYARQKEKKEIFIIGGAEILQQALAFIDRIYLTIVHHVFDGDVYFPELNREEWKEIEREEHIADEKNKYAYSFLTLQRKS